LCLSTSLFAQNRFKGIVLSTESGQPISAVIVEDLNTQKWVLSDTDGSFVIETNSTKNLKLLFKILGKQEKVITFTPETFNSVQTIYLNDQDLRLDELVINVKKADKFSEIKLGREQIDQVQAMSLNDVLELLPGQSITNFSLNEFKTIAFRTARPRTIANNAFGNKSFGTAIYLDGIPMSNNENMQSYTANEGNTFSPNYIGFGDGASSFNGSFTNSNYGSDLRGIATDNIESIEVVQGIPSVRYGDLTSGLIKIEQRAGVSPFKISSSLREGTMQHTFTKGFRLGERAGALNATIDYLDSNSDPRSSYTSYERINTQLMWTWNDKSKKIRNSFSFDYGFNKDNANYEAENKDNQITKNDRTDFGFSNRFKWNADKKLFDNLNVNANFKYTKQYSYDAKTVNVGGEVIGTSLEEGVYLGSYTAPSYRYEKAVDGKPLSAFVSANFSKSLSFTNTDHLFNYGVEYRMSDNKGKGRLGSPDSQVNFYALGSGDGGVGFRPFNYGQFVKAETIFSAYIEDEMVHFFENSKLNVSGGLRYDNFYGINMLAPRVNAYYEIPKMKFRAGYGITGKAPSLNQIYTGPRYYDVVLGDYRLPGVYNVAFVQTFIDDINNPNLGPSKSYRAEIGFDVMLPFGTLNITAYENKLKKGITDEAYPIIRPLAEIEVENNGTTTPDYEIVGYKDYYYFQNRIVNKYNSTDRGIEFFLSLKPNLIKNVTLDINGSYVETTNRNNIDTYLRSTQVSKPEVYGVFKPYDIKYKNFQVGANLTYHNPTLGLIVSVRSEHFLIRDEFYDRNTQPYAYLDANLDKHLIPEVDQNDTDKYGHIFRSRSTDNRKLDAIYHNFHLRVSKDFLNGFRFSFYVNNFLNLKPLENVNENGVPVQRVRNDMVNLSFGTKIEFTF